MPESENGLTWIQIQKKITYIIISVFICISGVVFPYYMNKLLNRADETHTQVQIITEQNKNAEKERRLQRAAIRRYSKATRQNAKEIYVINYKIKEIDKKLSQTKKTFRIKGK